MAEQTTTPNSTMKKGPFRKIRAEMEHYKTLSKQDQRRYVTDMLFNNAMYIIIVLAIIFIAIRVPSFVSLSSIVNIISLSAAMLNKGEPVGQAEHLLSRLQELCREGFTSPDFLTDSAIADTKRQQADNSIYAQETAAGVLSSLSFFWAACGADYFFDYDKRFERINAANVTAFVEAYLQDAGGMYVVFVSPDIYKANKAAFDKNGYTEITAGNAFWWQE